MGRETLSMSISMLVSRHNSEQDKLDNAAWDILCSEIQQLVWEFERDGYTVWTSGAGF